MTRKPTKIMGGGIIIRYGCPSCGHGLAKYSDGTTYCAWENKWSDSHIENKIPMEIQ